MPILKELKELKEFLFMQNDSRLLNDIIHSLRKMLLSCKNLLYSLVSVNDESGGGCEENRGYTCWIQRFYILFLAIRLARAPWLMDLAERVRCYLILALKESCLVRIAGGCWTLIVFLSPV